MEEEGKGEGAGDMVTSRRSGQLTTTSVLLIG